MPGSAPTRPGLRSPERLAADRIAQAVTERGRLGASFAEGIGRLAVEHITAAGLVVTTAARLSAMLDALRLAHDCIAGERAILVESDTIPDANEFRDESTMAPETKEAVAELDAVLAAIRAAMQPTAVSHG
jgi:hypothetical protein